MTDPRRDRYAKVIYEPDPIRRRKRLKGHVISFGLMFFILFFFVLQVEAHAAVKPDPCRTARTPILHAMCQMYVFKKQHPRLFPH